jgi:transposase
VADLPPDAYEVSGEKGPSRLAQRPGAYLILKDLRPVINRKETADLSGPPAPPAVFEKSFADVRGLAGLRIDKVAYPLPLYRQPQRLVQAGMRLSRGTLPQGVQRAAELLAPSSQALLSSMLPSQGLAMDEPPSKAGRHGKGKLHTGSCWPLSGAQDELAFPCAASRAPSVVREALGKVYGILLTDGYIVYERFAQTVNRLVPAPGWRQTRRRFVAAERAEPALVAAALDRIGGL